MSELIKPKNYEVVSYEETYDDGGFMDNSPKWLKILTIAGMVVAGLEIVGGITYVVSKDIIATNNASRMIKDGWESMGPLNTESAQYLLDTQLYNKRKCQIVDNIIYVKD